MIINFHNTPWEHGIIDNTYDDDLFNSAKQEIERFLSKKPIIKNDQLLYSFQTRTQELFPKTIKCMESFDLFKFYEKSKKSFSEMRSIAKNEKIIETNAIGIFKDYPHDIHYETPKKIFSFITYISPKEDVGTFLYKERNLLDFQKIVEWELNRTFFFFGINNKTWHSFTAGNVPRVTLSRFIEIE